jgi:regulator of ribonuclease activity A
MRILTADLCDLAEDDVQVADPVLSSFGGKTSFAGEIVTLKVHEDNSLVVEALASDGRGKVLVVDGGGSTRVALFGGNLAQRAHDNHWSGIVINGCVRDRLELLAISLGVHALASSPRRSTKAGRGERGVTVQFAGISFRPGEFLYADEDGLVVAPRDLLRSAGNAA